MVNIPFTSLFALLPPHSAQLLVSYSPKPDINAGGSGKFTAMCFGENVPEVFDAVGGGSNRELSVWETLPRRIYVISRVRKCTRPAKNTLGKRWEIQVKKNELIYQLLYQQQFPAASKLHLFKNLRLGTSMLLPLYALFVYLFILFLEKGEDLTCSYWTCLSMECDNKYCGFKMRKK